MHIDRAEEAINLRCLAYFVLASGLMLTGVYYFINEVKNTFMSPAESRQLNMPCAFLFFDNHSLWHFASAGGLLFTFMALLTLGKSQKEHYHSKDFETFANTAGGLWLLYFRGQQWKLQLGRHTHFLIKTDTQRDNRTKARKNSKN